MYVDVSIELSSPELSNLPGWRWARIKQLVLVGLSSSWHSEVCNALGDPFRIAHSKICDCGNLRTRGCQLLILTFFNWKMPSQREIRKVPVRYHSHFSN